MRSSSPWRIARTSAAHSSSSSRVVAKMRPLGIAPRQWPARPMRCKRHGNRARRADLADQIHVCRYRFPVPAKPSPPARAFRRPSAFASAASRSLRDRLPWCAATASLPERSRQMMRHALGQPPRVHENQRRAVLLHQLRDAVVNFVPHFVRGDRAQFARRALPRRDPVRGAARLPRSPAPAGRFRQELRDQFDRLLRGGKADAHRRRARCSASSRSSESARCAPRLSSATA